MQKQESRQDYYTLDDQDMSMWRAYSLNPVHGRRTKAERAFNAAVNESGTPLHKRRYKAVDTKDWKIVTGLMVEYYRLQEAICDEDNSDAQMQRAYIDQQHDILEELEVIYRKYLPVKK